MTRKGYGIKVLLAVILILLLYQAGFPDRRECLAATAEEVLNEASFYTGQLAMDARHFNNSGLLLKEWGGSDPARNSEGGYISRDSLLTWKTGNLTVNYADILGSQQQAADGSIYGRLVLNMPSDAVSSDGNYRFIIKTGSKEAVFYRDLPEGRFFIPLTLYSDRPYQPESNPLQKSAIAWRTASGWVKVYINPRAEAEDKLEYALPNSALNRLEIDESHYDTNTGILYADAFASSGELTTPDGVKVGKDEFLAWSTGTVLVRYADTFGSQKQDGGSTGPVYGVLKLKMPSGVTGIILKRGEGDAYFAPAGSILSVPLLRDISKPYDGKTNPLVKAAAAWKTVDGLWNKAVFVPVSQAESIVQGAAEGQAVLAIAAALCDEKGQLYADAVNKSGILKAKDGQTVLTRDNVLSGSAGLWEVRYAETLAEQVTGKGYGYLGLVLPANVTADNTAPRLVVKREGEEAMFYKEEGNTVWLPFIKDPSLPYHYQNNPLVEVTLAWRTDNGWQKAVLKPAREYRKPVLKGRFPYAEDASAWFDEKSLYPTRINNQERYFVGVVFADDDGTLKVADDILSLIRQCEVVVAGGSGVSMLDDELLDYLQGLSPDERENIIRQYIFIKDGVKKEASLRIPVKKLISKSRYEVRIASGLVFYENGEGNEAVSWSFTTMAVPEVNDIYVGSLGEDYDASEPLLIKGDFFYSRNVLVKFNDIAASRVEVVTGADGKSYLKVYLPSGSSRLQPGVYDITVINNSNPSYQTVLVGRLSIVKASGGEPVQEGVRKKKDAYYGEIREEMEKSEAVLALKSSFREKAYIYLPLDEIMPGSWRERKVMFSGYSWPVVRELTVNTEKAEAVFRNIQINRGEKDTVLTIGKLPLTAARGIGYQVPFSRLVSEMFIIKGEGARFDRLDVKLRFNSLTDRELKVMYYDETERRVYEVPCRIDYLNQEAIFSIRQSGIFFLAEK